MTGYVFFSDTIFIQFHPISCEIQMSNERNTIKQYELLFCNRNQFSEKTFYDQYVGTYT